MVLESTMICVDSSEYMRNGDYLPTRFQAQQDAVSMVCHSKTRSNPENNVGLLAMSSNPQVLTTLTTDVGRILSKLHAVSPSGESDLMTGIRVAHLALKHRQGKNHKMRIVVFVGSPVDYDEKELIKLAKRLKKEKVNVDIINFGEETCNTDKLAAFMKALEGTASHLVTVPPGPHLSDALISSPVIQGEDGQGAVGLGGSGFEFGIDPNEDPELALALRVSMEEQRQRQEEEARRVVAESASEGVVASSSSTVTGAQSSNTEEAMLEQALAMSLEAGEDKSSSTATARSSSSALDFANMTEEQQIAYAMQMSLQPPNPDASAAQSIPPESPVPMETDDDLKKEEDGEKKKKSQN